MVNRIILSLYAISGCLAYGHFWNNSGEHWEFMSRPIVGFFALVFNPIYWSTVIFQ